jgi:hypothetical protein
MDLESVNPELAEIDGQIGDILRALQNGFQKLDKIKDANRRSRQLEELTDKMRDCKRLSILFTHITLLSVEQHLLYRMWAVENYDYKCVTWKELRFGHSHCITEFSIIQVLMLISISKCN